MATQLFMMSSQITSGCLGVWPMTDLLLTHLVLSSLFMCQQDPGG